MSFLFMLLLVYTEAISVTSGNWNSATWKKECQSVHHATAATSNTTITIHSTSGGERERGGEGERGGQPGTHLEHERLLEEWVGLAAAD